MKKIPGINSSIVSVLFGIILAFSINQGLALALSTQMPVVAVESNSMVPTFQRGDILILQGVPQEELDVGDIIVFSPVGQNTPVVHRVVKVNGDGTFQTQGDANPGQLEFEKKIYPEQIQGRVIMMVPYLGWIKLIIMEVVLPNLLLVIVAGFVVFAAYSEARKKGVF